MDWQRKLSGLRRIHSPRRGPQHEKCISIYDEDGQVSHRFSLQEAINYWMHMPAGRERDKLKDGIALAAKRLGVSFNLVEPPKGSKDV